MLRFSKTSDNWQISGQKIVLQYEFHSGDLHILQKTVQKKKAFARFVSARATDFPPIDEKFMFVRIAILDGKCIVRKILQIDTHSIGQTDKTPDPIR